MKKIGFIGLGNMGLPMVLNLLEASLEVKAFDVSEYAIRNGEDAGINMVKSLDVLIQDIDVLITMLPNDSAVNDVFLNKEVLQKIDKNTLIIDSSTISPEVARKVSMEAAKLNLSMLDAPVSGGVKGAESGALTFIVGGEETNLKKAQPLFDIMGQRTFFAGKSGSGQVAKLCNNMLLAIHMCGTAEIIAMGVKSGLDPFTLSEIMKNSSGGNWSLDKYNPYPGIMKEAPASNNYAGGFLNSLMLKDLNLAEELAALSDSSIPMGNLAKQLYEELNQQGLKDLDFSSIQKNYLD
jgi:3-hydroxyisobutyrate dehydrogenase